MHLRVSGEQIWMARVHPPRSMAEASFRRPLVVLPLAVRGGGSRIEHATLERSGFIHLDQRCSRKFQTPLVILSLMGGVRNGVACEVGPVSCHVSHCVMLPSFHLYSTQPRDRARSYWPFANLVGIHPYWPVASSIRVRRLQSQMI
jgi:hypothetical protein